MEMIDCLVIGAGVVGLACARELALQGREVVIVEASADIGFGISSRNSEVIHAGIYYPTGSLKARLCLEGKRLLYDYAATRSVAHRRCGKLIVATENSQVDALEGILKKAHANGVSDLRAIASPEAIAKEPALSCVAALESPSTGIIDSHGLMLALLGEAQDHGAMLARLSVVQSLTPASDAGWQLELTIIDQTQLTWAGNAVTKLSALPGEKHQFHAKQVVNAAGLGANRIAALIPGMPKANQPPLYFAKGNYFSLAARCPFSRLIYPLPNEAGLGVHLTLDLAGQGRFGPDVEWVQTEDYSVNPQRAEVFYAAIRKYWPDLKDDALQPAYAGIRPKTVPQGSPDADFQVQGPDEHGVAGLVNFYGIESPGLTSSLALADVLCERLGLASPSQSA
ncbi:MAG: NAD(P)/FAD-dependent oxidoreductase [Betaproteobacteria bacterium]|nr:NAD(P)/FAD-dependent oxidoreductase [Betaproteobacteria bacterium]